MFGWYQKWQLLSSRALHLGISIAMLSWAARHPHFQIWYGIILNQKSVRPLGRDQPSALSGEHLTYTIATWVGARTASS